MSDTFGELSSGERRAHSMSSGRDIIAVVASELVYDRCCCFKGVFLGCEAAGGAMGTMAQ
jgi:hypothetical protein